MRECDVKYIKLITCILFEQAFTELCWGWTYKCSKWLIKMLLVGWYHSVYVCSEQATSLIEIQNYSFNGRWDWDSSKLLMEKVPPMKTVLQIPFNFHFQLCSCRFELFVILNVFWGNRGRREAIPSHPIHIPNLFYVIWILNILITMFILKYTERKIMYGIHIFLESTSRVASGFSHHPIYVHKCVLYLTIHS